MRRDTRGCNPRLVALDASDHTHWLHLSSLVCVQTNRHDRQTAVWQWQEIISQLTDDSAVTLAISWCDSCEIFKHIIQLMWQAPIYCIIECLCSAVFNAIHRVGKWQRSLFVCCCKAEPFTLEVSWFQLYNKNCWSHQHFNRVQEGKSEMSTKIGYLFGEVSTVVITNFTIVVFQD